MRMDTGSEGCFGNTVVYDSPHRPSAEAAAAVVEKHRLVVSQRGGPHFFPPCEPLAKRCRRRLAEGHHPLLAALPQDPENATVEVEIAPVEVDQFSHPKSGGIEKLENGPIPPLQRALSSAGVEKVLDLSWSQVAGKSPWLLGTTDSCSRVGGDESLATRKAKQTA
jgi:hypothetical protein